MFYYRPFASSFEESIKDEKCFNAFDDLLDYVVDNAEIINGFKAFDHLKVYLKFSGVHQCREINNKYYNCFILCVNHYGGKDYLIPRWIGFVYFDNNKKINKELKNETYIK